MEEKTWRRKTKIICTIGPASESEDMLRKLCLAGMDVARLNFSHGSHEDHKVRIDTIKGRSWGFLSRSCSIPKDLSTG